jgi:hypothetical protein
MRRGCLISSFLGALMFCSVAMAATEHNHGGGGAKAAPGCGDVAMLPSLNCAEAPGVGVDDNGRLWIVWAYGGHLYVQHSDNRGENFSSAVTVNRVPEEISARGENRPKIVVDRQGRVLVSWTTPLAKRFTGNIRFSRSLDGGEHFVEPLTVNDNRDITGHRFDAMGVNEKGDIYIVWLDKRHRLAAEQEGGEYSGAAVYYALSTNGGESFNANKKIIDHSCECCRIALDMDRDQLPVVMWRNIYGDNIRDHTLVKFSATNQPGEPVRVTSDQWKIDACPHHGPALSVADGGVFHMSWFNNAPERHGLFYGRAEQHGKELSQPISVGNYDLGASHPDILSLGQQVFLVWKEFDGKISTIRYMSSKDGGLSWSVPVTLAQSDGNSDYPFLLHHGGELLLSWMTQKEGYRLMPVKQSNDAIN